MSEVVYRRVTWLHRLVVWPVLFLCVIAPLLIYEQKIRDMLRPPPFATLSADGRMMPNGRWRVTYRFMVREQCRSVTWRKVFRFEGGDDLLLDAVDGLRRNALPAVQSGGTSAPGPLEFWLEYEPIAGLGEGAFLVSGTFADCPSGYQDALNLPPVAVDWR